MLGPKRLGYDVAISCDGTQLLDYIGELGSVTRPVRVMWGDQGPDGAASGRPSLQGRGMGTDLAAPGMRIVSRKPR